MKETHPSDPSRSTGGPAAPPAVARLQAIQDLVHSGAYHVPATVIADRMIERMMAEKRGPKH